jgi:hypothetical protein
MLNPIELVLLTSYFVHQTPYIKMPSSVITNYHYNAATQTLIITFVSGTVYHYKHVPQSIYDRMKAVTSKGIFFNLFIKDKYTFEKVN